MKLIFLFGLLAANGFGAKIEPDCSNGYLTYSPPPVGSLNEIFPDGTGTTDIVLFPDNYRCNIGVNVPVGMWARVLVTIATTGPAGNTAPVTVIDSLGRSENLYSSDTEPFYFLSGGGNVTLSTAKTNASFVMVMHWYKYPTTFTPNNISLNISDSTPQVLSLRNMTTPTLVLAQSRVATLVIPPTNSTALYELRKVVFYSGPNWNRTYIGNAKQAWESGRTLNTEGNFLTVQFLDTVDNDMYLLFQETDNTEQLSGYQGIACSATSTTDCQAVLQTTSDPSAFSTIQGDFGYETVTNLTGNGTLDVYIGGVTKDQKNLIATYAVGQSDLRLPQAFNGNVRTYVLRGNNTKAVINFTPNSRNSVYRPIGFKGFISSNHYTETPKAQWAEARVEAPRDTLTAFSFTIKEADMTSHSQLNITIYESPNQVSFVKSYSSGNLPAVNENIRINGKTMVVEFDTMGEASAGLYIDYEMVKSSSSFCVVFSILLTLFVAF